MNDAFTNAHSDFLSYLSDEETAALLGCARKIHLEKNQSVFNVGDLSGTVYIVAKGCIKLFRLTSDGKEVIFWLSFPGEIFGLAELFNEVDREISAEANIASEILAISRADILRFFRSHPEAAMRAICILSARLRSLEYSLINLATEDVETRLLRLLLRLSAVSKPRVMASSNSDMCINYPLTHQDIANQIGASRQTVSSTLASLKRRGVIEVKERRIHIPNREKMIRELEASE